eukprot:4172382-Pleurochrysis_carterae.AAC.1
MVIACTHTDPTLQMTALATLEALAGADANTLAKVVEVVEVRSTHASARVNSSTSCCALVDLP